MRLRASPGARASKEKLKAKRREEKRKLITAAFYKRAKG
jgi:hypothetical protein